MKRKLWLTLAAGAAVACATAGSSWVEQPLPGASEGYYEPLLDAQAPPEQGAPARARPASRTLSNAESNEGAPDLTTAPESSSGADALQVKLSGAGGRALGTFRNTYYDFPSELDFEGADLELKNGRCDTIAKVKRGFFEAVCVQGSGTLRDGGTVSFAKRDCDCADLCPRTSQKICFDLLDPKSYPWGRGATGKAITPLLTVAVDADVIALGTAIYVPEFDGLPRDPGGTARHDGCLIAQDRGLKVKGQHLDIFTGHRSVTELWNRLVPSNRGVTVVVDSTRCARASGS